MLRGSRAVVLSAALLAFLFATNIYRATTQSITIDEAFTYNHFVASRHGVAASESPYNDNLNAWLCRLSVGLLGVSEFAMRLPSLLGGLLYFVFLFRLCRLIFGDSGWLLLAVALNSLNPFVLDYLSAARGYGMGLGFWTLGAYYLTRYVIDGTATVLLVKAGIALGLAVGSHVTETFGVVALEAAFAVIILLDRLLDGRGGLRMLVRGIVPLGVSTGVVASAILWATLHNLQTKFIDNVRDRYVDGVKSLVDAIVFYKPTIITSFESDRDPVHRLAWLLLPVLLVGLIVAAGAIVLRWRKTRDLRELDGDDRVLLIFSSTVLLTFLLLWIEPALLHHGYFADRRLLFTLPMILVAGPLWARWLMRRVNLAGYVSVALLSLLAVQFALEFNLKYYRGWEFDAETKRVAGILRDRHTSQSNQQIRVGVNWLLAESLNFYRVRYGLDWMAAVTRDSPECSYDYYYVLATDISRLRRFGVRELYRCDTAQTVLAEPGEEARKRLVALREGGFLGVPVCSADVMTDAPFVELGHAGAQRHLLRDFMEGAETDQWRWTFARPALLFHVSERANMKFKMDFLIPSQTFKSTGPLRMTVWLNGRRLGEKTYDAPEQQTFEQAVSPEWLRSDGISLIETTLDKYLVADDGQKLGYLFLRGGFIPAAQ